MKLWIQGHALAAACLAAGVMAGLAGCSSGGTDGPTVSANFVLAPVDGGSCRLLDASGASLAGPVLTNAGQAYFGAVPRSSGYGQIVCEGGKYKDEATGASLTAPRLRSHVNLDAAVVDAAVTPLTELAVRQLGSRSAATDYPAVLAGIARSFGLAGLDIARQVPTDLNTTALGNTNAGRYGAVLAALSQLQAGGQAGQSADAVLGTLAAALDSQGRFTDADVRDHLAEAIEAVGTNPLHTARVGTTGMDTLRTVFDSVAAENVMASVLLVDTDQSLTQSGGPDHTVPPNATSTIALIGRNLYMGLDVRLGNKACTPHDLESLDDPEVNSDLDGMLADCPPTAAGKATLTVTDRGTLLSQTDITIVAPAIVVPAARALQARATGDANVAGRVTAVAPTIDLPSGGALSYGSLRSFNVKGVVVELLDGSAGNALLATTSTDDSGQYRFSGVPSGRQVTVRVKAQLQKTATAASPSQWDFSVRDNTSSSSPKALYALDSAATQLASGDNTVNLNATLGFDAAGNELPDPARNRQSAAFSILEVVYSAATKLQANDPAVKLPALNIYWSVNNVDAEGDREKGQISTSHFAAEGTLPGVFILGKANVDTDEFDQGVIGHEFGHYLQAVLSFSDNPGGTHAQREFKDASLAFGEGYGTAVGGLLSGSPYYTDSKGKNQSLGALTDLSAATPAGARKGFYSEESVAYVMYNLGLRHGFSAFWRAVSTMKDTHYSATIFSFLNFFLQQNPAAQSSVTDLMAIENLRSTDPLGQLPAGAAADPAINATASKGAADLETLYLTVPLASTLPTAPASLVASPPQFCLNRNLPGANLHNGLGVTRRFTFVAPSTGSIGIRAADDKDAPFSEQTTDVSARDSTGKPVTMLRWAGGFGAIPVVAGRTYTVKLLVDASTIFNGNRCGNTLALWWLGNQV